MALAPTLLAFTIQKSTSESLVSLLQSETRTVIWSPTISQEATPDVRAKQNPRTNIHPAGLPPGSQIPTKIGPHS
ncbi:hypothetical protein ECG_02438 [Echinococcus granulosus]|uniref:Secreted protein n=1 Tax=Echinococcus granulosus TaxID=6210 RepID=A0A068WXJ1_ECHGR|nr:hypothetical protein ECG_02438 [Echinococcus granulosus]CDS23220.1 hypothetical protein EgrG_002036500 [Echinococcus granulosus]